MPHAFTLANDIGTLAFEALGEAELGASLSDIIEHLTGRRYAYNQKLHIHPPVLSVGISMAADISVTIVMNDFEGLDEVRLAIEATFEAVLRGDNPVVRVVVHVNAVPILPYNEGDPRPQASWGPISNPRQVTPPKV